MTGDSPVRLGIVTGSAAPKLTSDGQALRSRLRDRGFTASAANWRDTSVKWSSFDGLIVRSCWEYHEEPEKFRAWLSTIDGKVRHVINPVQVIEWNMHKAYLQELGEEGVTVTPTACVEQGMDEDLANVCERKSWDHVVVKPAIGTSSDGVWQATVPVSTDANERFRAELAGRDLLVQPFLPEIASGELSMVFFEGEYSHASRTVPETSDFRAHNSFGASSESVTPSETVRETGTKILETTGEIHNIDPEDLTYARIDGIERDGSFVLLELELIEPYLTLSAGDNAIEMFVDAIEHSISEQVTAGEEI